MKVLVTGASGFIGSRFVYSLLDAGHDVVATGRRSVCPHSFDKYYLSKDLQDYSACLDLVSEVDCVIHCAGKAGVWGSYSSYYDANVTVTNNLLKASKKAHVKKFVNISSPSITFEFKHQFKINEDHIPKKFSNAYAKTKYLAELAVSEFHCDQMWTMSLRPRGVIGVGDVNFVPRMIDLRLNDKLVQVGSSPMVDFTSIENLSALIVQIVSGMKDIYGRVYNITNNMPVNFWEFVEGALSLVGLDAQRKKVPLYMAMKVAQAHELVAKALKKKDAPRVLPMYVGVAGYSKTFDISRAIKFLNYNPIVTNQQSLEKFAKNWLKKNKNG